MTHTSDGGATPPIRIRLEDHEADLMRKLTAEMKMLLEADIPKTDPVIARLFPAAYESDEDTRAYEALTADDLRDAKRDALASVTSTLGDAGLVDVPLSGDQTHAWLTFLTDLRLSIGTRLDVTEAKMSADIDLDDPEAPALSVLHWLGWLQESILHVLNRPDTDEPGGEDD